MNKHALLVALAVPLLAVGGALATFYDGYPLRAADMNANFNHIHTTMVGGHGARLVNSDVAATAGIAHSKLATPQLVPKAWAVTAPTCSLLGDGGYTACPVTAGYGVTSITHATTGEYLVTWTTPRPNVAYGVIVSIITGTGASCTDYSHSTTFALLRCYTSAGALTDVYGFTVLIMDDDD